MKKTNIKFTELYEPLYMRPLSEIRFQGYIYESLNDETRKINYYQKALMSFYEAYKDCNGIDERYRDDILKKVTSNMSRQIK